ncbi:DUF1573 domain-containing protein [Pontibacter arcticus]|uniref:DUF1573 domain-containing protein n=1 Tax=Pontibacter arcticus TaxID=2080288 RepID=A0A364RGG8_9BACT|nr:DUF1573 domain-containing protein [Pontibacter arcticus]RAU83382.1 DUF1573 domain-containing protein [Pontibacter arcticus]
MSKRWSLAVLLFLVLAGFSVRAQGDLRFEKQTHDFGTITEGTFASYEFRVKNVGNQPAIISDVRPACGCTTPTWPKEPILPGKIAAIKAVYNSTGRPGAFHKSISIVSDGVAQSQVLYIKGNVVPKDQKSFYTPEQKANSPRLAVGNTSYSFGKLEKGQKSIARFTVKNTGRQDLIIQGIKSDCNCVTYKVSEPSIKAGQTATLELTYVPAVLKEHNEVVTILSNDIIMPALKLTLKATIVEQTASQHMLRQGN